MKYPDSKRTNDVDDYHGKPVRDPYRWLEKVDSPNVEKWLNSQNELSERVFAALPHVEIFRARLNQLRNGSLRALPVVRDGMVFYAATLEGRTGVWAADSWEAPARLVLDFATFPAKSTVPAHGWIVSPDLSKIAYGYCEGGSDWGTWRVRDIETGVEQPDTLTDIAFYPPTWGCDSESLYYVKGVRPSARYGPIDTMRLYVHRMGHPMSDDTLLLAPEASMPFIRLFTSPDAHYVAVLASPGCPRSEVAVAFIDTQEVSPVVRWLVDSPTDFYDFVDASDTAMWFLTTNKASRGKLVRVDVTERESPVWTEVIPESENVRFEVERAGSHFVCHERRDVCSALAVYRLEGQLVRDLSLPGNGAVGHILGQGLSGHQSIDELWVQFSGLAHAPELYKYNLLDHERRLADRYPVDISSNDLEAHQVFYPAKDGTSIPMFLLHKKGLDTTKTHPAYLTAYGGFGFASPPAFSDFATVWAEHGGVMALANVRGGGEYGADWHNAGRRTRQQTCIDDFIAGAEFLIGQGITSRAQLAIYGRSNGGTLVSACIAQRPELFGAAVPAVGLSDLLRFPHFTWGKSWRLDLGDPDNPRDFEALIAWSPLHNLCKGARYPAVFVPAAQNDDRAVPMHSYKLVAALQHAAGGSSTALLHVARDVGHGGIDNVSAVDERVRQDSWVLGFMAASVGLKMAAPG